MSISMANPGQTPAKMVINRVIGSNEEQDELSKMAHGVVDEQRRYL